MSDIHASLTTPPDGYGEWLTAVVCQVKGEHDTPIIGHLPCKNKNKIVPEYALADKTRPKGTTEYKWLKSLPADLQNSMPSIERELAGNGTLMEESQ